MSEPLTVTRAGRGLWLAAGSLTRWSEVRVHAADRPAAAQHRGPRAGEFLAVRALLRHLLRSELPDLVGLPVEYGPLGGPRLRGAPRYGLSLSHDARWVAVAVARDRSVGIDVQSPPEQVSDRFLGRCPAGPASVTDGAGAVRTRTALDQLGHLPMARRALEAAWFWTAREACAKAAGTGLGSAPWRIPTTLGGHCGTWGPYSWCSLRETSPVPLSFAVAQQPNSSSSTTATPSSSFDRVCRCTASSTAGCALATA
ncbi:4'-phosphopantetheinyl transferase family protein [Streptomyces anulatus]